jgi:hypothetical protein
VRVRDARARGILPLVAKLFLIIYNKQNIPANTRAVEIFPRCADSASKSAPAKFKRNSASQQASITVAEVHPAKLCNCANFSWNDPWVQIPPLPPLPIFHW